MAFLQQLRSEWHQLEKDPPGKRFQNRYRRKHDERGGKKNPLMLVVGAVVMAVGVFLMPAPGPGVIVVLLGGALLSEESLFVARALDRLEVWVREVVAAALRLWKRMSLPLRIALILLAAALVAGIGWLGYSIVLD
jgi:uncharacterized protein (TIGR02611 family)